MKLLAICFFSLVFFVGCPGKSATEPPKPGVKTGEKTVTGQAVPEKKVAAFRQFKGLSLEGLTDEQREAFIQMANDEVCPCDCPKTFAGCLQGIGCKPATLLAQWVIERIKEGVPVDMIASALPKDVAGFSGQAKTIATRGYPSKGNDKAPMTIVEYADFECIHCKEASRVLHDLVEKPQNKIRLVYKYFPLPSHRMAQKAALSAEAAHRQHRFWEMHDALYRSMGNLNDDLIEGHAKAIGLNMALFQKDYKDTKVAQSVQKSFEEAESLGLNGTPAIFVNGRFYGLSLDKSGLELRIAMEEARANATCN